MLLRASSEFAGEKADLGASVGRGGDGGIPHGDRLLRFAAAVTRGDDDSDETDAARLALRAAVGEAAFVDAAAIVGIFNGLVRTADATGIPLDENTLHTSSGFRVDLALNDFAGAANTSLEHADPAKARGDGLGAEAAADVAKQFG
jgi:hypothetical protein